MTQGCNCIKNILKNSPNKDQNAQKSHICKCSKEWYLRPNLIWEHGLQQGGLLLAQKLSLLYCDFSKASFTWLCGHLQAQKLPANCWERKRQNNNCVFETWKTLKIEDDRQIKITKIPEKKNRHTRC